MARIKLLPGGKEAELEGQINLLKALKIIGSDIKHSCGGSGECGDCKLRVLKGGDNLSPVTDSESKAFSESELEKGYRLACQTRLLQGEVEARLPAYSSKSGVATLESGREVNCQINPLLRKLHLYISQPTIKDPRPDHERLTDQIEQDYDITIREIDSNLQKNLPEILRTNKTSEGLYEVTVTVFKNEEIVDVEVGWKKEMYGLAVDVGTTTMVSHLVDLSTGETISSNSILNPQSKMGGDIVTRVSEVQRKGSKKRASKLISQGINELIRKNVDETEIQRNSIYHAVLVGNSAMHHLGLELDTRYLSRSPYVLARGGKISLKSNKLNLEMNESGYVTWLPLNGGWVGADNVGTLLTAGFLQREGTTLAIDIGTNGEVAISNGNRALVTSTAAGPALEGYNIKYGSIAKKGSIEEVSIDRNTLKPGIKTIDNADPVGICGSGIIDVTSELLLSGVISSDGRFNNTKDSKRVRKGDNGKMEYVLAYQENSGLETDLTITQSDIREIQKAKGAIQAASRVLMEELAVDKIDHLLVAGAFGNQIKPESALTIGLFPNCEREKIELMGNAAGSGAKLALLDEEKMIEAEEISDFVEFYGISGTEDFKEHYMKALNIPNRNLDLYPKMVESVPSVAS